jgi:hypothetical protein
VKTTSSTRKTGRGIGKGETPATGFRFEWVSPFALEGILCYRNFAPVAESGFRHGFLQTDDLVASLELATLLEQFDAFEPFQNVSLCGDLACAAEASMLRHCLLSFEKGSDYKLRFERRNEFFSRKVVFCVIFQRFDYGFSGKRSILAFAATPNSVFASNFRATRGRLKFTQNTAFDRKRPDPQNGLDHDGFLPSRFCLTTTGDEPVETSSKWAAGRQALAAGGGSSVRASHRHADD